MEHPVSRLRPIASRTAATSIASAMLVSGTPSP
jgi:hypothetical protein